MSIQNLTSHVLLPPKVKKTKPKSSYIINGILSNISIMPSFSLYKKQKEIAS